MQRSISTLDPGADIFQPFNLRSDANLISNRFEEPSSIRSLNSEQLDLLGDRMEGRRFVWSQRLEVLERALRIEKTCESNYGAESASAAATTSPECLGHY